MYSIYVCIYIYCFFLIEVYVDMVIQSTKGRIHQEYGIALTTQGRKYRCEKGHGGDVTAK